MSKHLDLIWKHTHNDSRGLINGQRYVLSLRQGGTQSVPLDSLTPAEVADKLSYAIWKEAQNIGHAARAASNPPLPEADASSRRLLHHIGAEYRDKIDAAWFRGWHKADEEIKAKENEQRAGLRMTV
jgi:hypothetical protein